MVATFLSVVPAHATTDSVACSGSNTAYYTPPLTNQQQNVTLTIDIDWNLCVSTEPGLTSGISGGVFSRNRSCLDLLGQTTSTFMVTWNTGQTSTYTENANVILVGAVYTVIATGTVIDGLFKDHAITINYTAPAVDILTCTAGLGTVSKVELVGTLVIAPA